MPAKSKQRSKSPILDHIRKPTAPPTKKMGLMRPESKVHPSGRKTKHKVPKNYDSDNGDI